MTNIPIDPFAELAEIADDLDPCDLIIVLEVIADHMRFSSIQALAQDPKGARLIRNLLAETQSNQSTEIADEIIRIIATAGN
jgi:L-ascorbate metabolism protein UlaG (beta-lactamase superfamily)